MKFIRHILRLCVVMLLSSLGANMAFSMPMSTSEISFYRVENTLLTQADYVGFAARAPPLAVPNVAVTGCVSVVHGSAFALHGQQTVAVLFGFDRPANAPNRTLSKSQIVEICGCAK